MICEIRVLKELCRGSLVLLTLSSEFDNYYLFNNIMFNNIIFYIIDNRILTSATDSYGISEEPGHCQNVNMYIFTRGPRATAVLTFGEDCRDGWN